MRALIVDDSRAVRMMMRRALSQCGFDDFAEAGDGQEALDALESGSLPDVAFVDWNMPVMNGIEFVRSARARADYAAMKIIMVTSETSFDIVAEALDTGADEFVMKPFTPEIIAEKLALVG